MPGTLHVTELGVRHQHAVVQQRRTDARAERREDREPGLILRGAVAHLGDPGDIRVVREVDVAAQAVLEELLGLEIDPLLGHVGGRQRAPVLDDRGERHSERNRLVVGDAQGRQHLPHRSEDVRRVRPSRRRDLHAVADEFALVEIDDPRLDPGAADVHADGACRVRCHVDSLSTRKPSPTRRASVGSC